MVDSLKFKDLKLDQLNTLQEAYEQSKMELNKSKTDNSPSSTNKKKKNNRRLQFRRSNSSGY